MTVAYISSHAATNERRRVISIVGDINFSVTYMDRPNSDYEIRTRVLFYKCVTLFIAIVFFFTDVFCFISTMYL